MEPKERCHQTNDVVRVVVLPSKQRVTGKIVNISKAAAQLELPIQPPIGANLEIVTIGIAIFGEIRSCQPVGSYFCTELEIEHTVFLPRNEHIDNDSLSRYALGRGLKAHQVLRINEHLERCNECRSSFVELATTQGGRS